MFSVIIPTYNASKHLPLLLDSIKSQTLKEIEIIIIDSTSLDNTIEIADSFGAQVIKIPKNEFNHGGTRALAARNAKGEIIIFLSQDAIPYDQYSLEKLVKPFDSDESIAAIFGRQLPNKDASIFAEHLRLFNYPEDSYIRELADREKFGLRTIFFSNSFSAYRKCDLEEIGYFKEGLNFGEDTHAAAKLLLNNKKIAYESSSKVYHSHNYTIRQDFRRYFDMGAFHRKESPLLNQFGKANRSTMRLSTGRQGYEYMKSEFAFIRKKKRLDLFPEFVLRILAKFLGYQLGRHFRRG